MLDLGLLQSPTFLVLAISGFLTLFCFFVPFAFIGELAADRISSNKNISFIKNNITNNLNEDNSGSASQLLLVLLGLFNVLGRVLCGYISDHPKVDPLIVSNIALIIGGIATAFAPLLNQLWMFAIYCFPFAFGAASFAALRSIICVELLGIERLSSAFGMLMLFMGYGLSFHIMGIMMVVSGAMCIPLRNINAWEERKNIQKLKNEKENEEKIPELQPLNK
uniref:MFS domain-containing protein n=1 Tax=Meloidogyne hapla TaxID=6305 RepID=A0A1I8BRB6_MELHA